LVVDNDSPNESTSKISFWIDQENLTEKVTLISNHQNNGYGGGNNFGIEYCKIHFNYKKIWILNNDCYLESNALAPMLKCIEEKNEKTIIGSVILRSSDGKLECYGGGIFYPLLGKAKLYLKGKDKKLIANNSNLIPDYIMGCSLLITKDFIEEVGLMDEMYFMYSEEVDWQKRAFHFGWKLKVASTSFVYHVGSGGSGGRSPSYHFMRNKAAILFNKKFYGFGFTLVSAFLLMGIQIIIERNNAKNIYSGIYGIIIGLKTRVKRWRK
jgi:GT2 family glycosyltransferase